MPAPIQALLQSLWFPVLARILLTFCFWGSGLAKLIDFQGGTAEMAVFGFSPPALVNAVVIATQLGGSLLIISGRHVWLGTGMLAVFTGLTILLVHHFWTMEGEAAIAHFHTATEHVTVIGAMMVMAVLSTRPRPGRPFA
ncbi:DoxX family protein [Aureimonas sp. AU12]|uniref:DoxX family protein n=1 Tax=Aureimonas sp. AU12 TaxID=1638161 RepID=UPI000781743F|nr:DoxX family protein [Aureimonas sp. AU12]